MAKRAPKSNNYFANSNGCRPELVIAPSILSADFAAMGKELAKCRRARASWIHIDVMDGHFVPNMTLGPPMIKSWREAEPTLFFDTHLMVDNPMQVAEMFRDAGTQTLTIHAEASTNPLRDLRKLKRMGVKAGISIKPGTSIRAIKECLAVADIVLVMTVEPGFGGQRLIPKTLEKVRALDLARREHGFAFRLQVDGGINKKTARLAVAAGADVLVAGSAVFSSDGTVSENVKELKNTIGEVKPKNPARTKRPKKSKS